MMQSSNNRAGSNTAADLNEPHAKRRTFVQRQVVSRFVVVANEIFQNLTHMCLAM
jgi:hypothetical protein